jgi:hypothetical protein
VVEAKADALVKLVEGLVAEKEALATKEKELVEALNAALGRMGYQVVPMAGTGNAGKRRGRPPGSGNGRKKGATRDPGRPPKNGRKKRRGRPPKAEQG